MRWQLAVSSGSPSRFATSRDFGGVVEATLADALCMQWHGDQAVGPGRVFDGVRHARAQCRRDGELTVVFQARDHPVERKRIRQRRMRAVERGRALEAGAAHLAGGRGRGALRTLWLAVPGQIVQTGAAQGAGCRGCAAEQTGVGNTTPHVRTHKGKGLLKN